MKVSRNRRRKGDKMKQKTRRLSIRAKILWPAILLILAVCIILGLTAYVNINKGMVAMGVEEAQMAAKVAQSAVDGDLVKTLQAGDEETEAYQTLITAMRDVQQNFGIAYLYTLYTDGSKVYYGVDTDQSEKQAKICKEFEKSYEQLAATFGGEDSVQEYIDNTGYGNVISVYKPVTDDTGAVVAVIGCDYDAEDVVTQLNQITRTVLIVTVACLLIAVAMIGIIIGKISKNLRRVDRKLYDLVHNEGDLTQELEIHTGDELELIAGNVNALLGYIRTIMLNIAADSEKLNLSSKNVVTNLSSAEVNITDVSATMEQMSAAMEETSASLSQVNTSIGTVYETIQKISGNAEEGRNSTQAVMKNAADIYEAAAKTQRTAHAQANELAAVVNEKIEQSKAVEEISDLTANIIGITEQTNLLALNASIEAARAGEAGKGFAVVADEIGKLATNSSETAAQIQQVSAAVIQAVNELAQKAQQMLAFMDEVAMGGYEKLLETSRDYQNNIGQINQMMQDFANESVQVRGSVDQIKDAVAAINLAVEESAKGVTGVTETAVDLTSRVGDIGNEANSNMNIAELLNVEVNKFKLE